MKSQGASGTAADFTKVISEKDHAFEKRSDGRLVSSGSGIPTESYCDQPYIVKTDDGAWLCVVTTGHGVEGQEGQHIITLRSTNQGKSWSDPVAVEPADGPEASYAVLLKVPDGRIYCFYNHNTDNLRKAKADDPPFEGGFCMRVDSLGYFVYKYSDDHGRTWSDKRYPIEVREMAIDRENPYGGKVQYFWNVGKPFAHEGSVYVSLHKVGGFGFGYFTRSEGVLLKSENILQERNPENISWETLPDGDAGLRTPKGGGPVAEEHSYCVLSDGSFYSVYRSIDGYPVCAISRDGGHTWSKPTYQPFADGRRMKNPRAANFAWRCSNGKYIYWFHNQGGRIMREEKDHIYHYENRNPVWLSGGIEEDTAEGKTIKWSEPEIILYHDDPIIRMSYPDFIEEDGEYYISETQKHIARVHQIDKKLLEALWNQFENRRLTEEGLILSLPQPGQSMPKEVGVPLIPVFGIRDMTQADRRKGDLRQGFALELWIKFNSLQPGQRVLDTRLGDGRGICLRVSFRKTLELVLNDRQNENTWDTDIGTLKTGQYHHVVVNVDGGPKIISFIVDGRLLDGGDQRQYGWGRFSPNLKDVNGSERAQIAPDFDGEIKVLRLYNRYLMTSEAIGNYRAGY